MYRIIFLNIWLDFSTLDIVLFMIGPAYFRAVKRYASYKGLYRVLVKTQFWRLLWLGQHCFIVQCRLSKEVGKKCWSRKNLFTLVLRCPYILLTSLEYVWKHYFNVQGLSAGKGSGRSRLEESITPRRQMLSPPIPGDHTREGSQDQKLTELCWIESTMLWASALWSGLAGSKYILVSLTGLSGDNINDFSTHI